MAKTTVVENKAAFKRGFPWERWNKTEDMKLIGFPSVIKRVDNPRNWNHKQLLVLFNMCASDSIGPLLPPGVDFIETETPKNPAQSSQSQGASSDGTAQNSRPSTPIQHHSASCSTTPIQSRNPTPYPTPDNPMSIHNLVSPKSIREKLHALANAADTVSKETHEDQGVEEEPQLVCDVDECPYSIHGRCETYGCNCLSYYCRQHFEDAEEHDFIWAVLP